MLIKHGLAGAAYVGAGGAVAVNYITAEGLTTNNGTTGTYETSSISFNGKKTFIGITTSDFTAGDLRAVDVRVNGVSTTQVAGTPANNGNFLRSSFWEITPSSGSFTVQVDIENSSTTATDVNQDVVVAVFELDNYTQTDDTAGQSHTSGSTGWSFSNTVNTLADGAVMAIARFSSDPGVDGSWTNETEHFQANPTNASNRTEVASSSGLSAATPYSVTVTDNGTTVIYRCVMSTVSVS